MIVYQPISFLRTYYNVKSLEPYMYVHVFLVVANGPYMQATDFMYTVNYNSAIKYIDNIGCLGLKLIALKRHEAI